MRISLGSWAFTFGPYASNPIPFEDIVNRLSSSGYDGIEICGFPPHVTLEKYAELRSRRELARYLKEKRLGVSGYAADLSSVNPVAPGNRQKYLELFERNVQLCADIESPVIRVDTVAAPGSIPDSEYGDSLVRVADLWRAAATIAQRHEIAMVWEFEPGFVFNKPSEVILLHDRVSHPNFKLMFDTAHAYMCAVIGARQHGPKETLPGGVAELLAKLKGRIGAIHLIDSDGTLHGDETSTHRPFGEGYVDFRALAPQLLTVSGIGWWCVDMCFWGGSWNLVEPSLQFVQNLLKSKAAA